MLFAICYLLFAICYLLFAICYLCKSMNKKTNVIQASSDSFFIMKSKCKPPG